MLPNKKYCLKVAMNLVFICLGWDELYFFIVWEKSVWLSSTSVVIFCCELLAFSSPALIGCIFCKKFLTEIPSYGLVWLLSEWKIGVTHHRCSLFLAIKSKHSWKFCCNELFLDLDFSNVNILIFHSVQTKTWREWRKWDRM